MWGRLLGVRDLVQIRWVDDRSAKTARSFRGFVRVPFCGTREVNGGMIVVVELLWGFWSSLS